MKIPVFLKELFNFRKGREGQKPLSTKEKWMLFMLSGILLAVIIFPGEKKKSDTRSDLLKDGSLENQGLFTKAGYILGETTLENGSDLLKDLEKEVYNLKQYEVYLSRQLEYILSEMDGAGCVQAWVTISGSSEKILYQTKDLDNTNLQESDSVGGSRLESKESTKQEVLIDSAGNPYIVKTLQPEVEGVLVIAEGAGNSVIKKNITEAVEVLFGIDSHRIKVAKKKVEE